jgi:hypothetical protein
MATLLIRQLTAKTEHIIERDEKGYL